ncbi:MAG: replicative DNA helicase, partial [Clostridia bacterium]|nr:replicative DNA helicase [Clostridia bacterium]
MPNNEQPKNQITMPNSVEAEQNVLCCILRSPEMQLEIIAQLKAADFYQPNHQIIFQAMKDISNQSHKTVGEGLSVNTVNLATVVDHLRRIGKLEQVGDIDYILRLNELLPSTANFDEYITIVKRASTMRQLIVICDEVKAKAYTASTSEEAITYAEEKIFALSQGGANGGLVLLADDTARTMHNINERFVNPGKFRGIQTGYTRFDRLTNGLHGGELIVLAARPGVGKSAMAMNIAENVAKQGKTVAIFSLEMSNEQIIERMMSGMSGVPLEYIKSGQLPNGEADLEKLRIAQETICGKMKMYGNDYASIKPSEIASQCRRLKQQHGLDLIVIDYIQLMNSGVDAIQGRQNEVAAISRA